MYNTSPEKKRPPLVLPPYLKPRMRSPQKVNEDIVEAMASDRPFLLARFGGIEGKLVGELILRQNKDLDPVLVQQAQLSSGITPPGRQMLRRCAVETLAAGMKTDILAVWNYDFQSRLANFTAPEKLCLLKAFDPVLLVHKYDATPWTRALAGKKVLIVHPFLMSIRKQIDRLSEIDVIRHVWPEKIEFDFMMPPVTYGGEHGEKRWDRELARAKAEMARRDFDVVLVAAGSYGMPLAAFAKDMGRKAFHFGGALQLSFGIIGARWEKQAVYEGVFTEGWIRPDESEVPSLHKRIDKSAYW